MNRRRASAAVVLGSAVVCLATACGPEGPGQGAAPTASAPSVPSAPASPSSTPSPSSTSMPSSPASPAAGTTGAGRKPCYRPAGYDGFFKLDSAEVYQGHTTVRVTPETCSVDPGNDEDVSYTPIEAARSFVVGSGASVKVLSGTGTPDPVSPSWLVNHPLVNSPYFFYRLDSQGQIAAIQEIYHP